MKSEKLWLCAGVLGDLGYECFLRNDDDDGGDDCDMPTRFFAVHKEHGTIVFVDKEGRWLICCHSAFRGRGSVSLRCGLESFQARLKSKDTNFAKAFGAALEKAPSRPTNEFEAACQ
jgi:hypothetical protein